MDFEALLDKADEIGNNHKSGKKYVYAVYSETDGSLKFYNREEVPDEGSMLNGRKVTSVMMDGAYDFCNGWDAPWLNNVDMTVYDSSDEVLGMSRDDQGFEEKAQQLFKDGGTPVVCNGKFGQYNATAYAYEVNDSSSFEWSSHGGNWTYRYKRKDANNPHIKSVEVVDSGIKPNYMKNWFVDCPNLEHADMSKLDLSSIAHQMGTRNLPSGQNQLDNCFVNCPKLDKMPDNMQQLSNRLYSELDNIYDSFSRDEETGMPVFEM